MLVIMTIVIMLMIIMNTLMVIIMMILFSHSTVEEVSQNEIRIAWGVGIVGHVAQTGLSCNVSDCYQDSRWVIMSTIEKKFIDNRIDGIST